jgi:hypothetical protein
VTAPRPPYPECREPFTFPEPGVRTWQAPDRYLFGECKGGSTGDTHVCPVGVYKVSGRVHGCDCTCHTADRNRLTAR